MNTLGQNLYQAIQMFCWPRLRRVCVAAITYRDDGADESTWDMAPFADGRHFLGADVTRLLVENEYEVLVLQHWPTAAMVRRLRALLPKVRLLLWVPVEAVTGHPWAAQTGESAALWSLLMGRRLLGTDGQPVDLYYGNLKGAAYAVDMLDPTLVEVVAPALVMPYHVLGVDGLFIDSTTDWDYFGTAPNAPARRNRTQVWWQLVNRLRVLAPGAELWGNTVGPVPGAYGLDVSFAEHYVFLAGGTVEGAARRLARGVCLNPSRSDWPAHPDRWPYLAHAAVRAGLGEVYVCTAWTGQHLFEPEWR